MLSQSKKIKKGVKSLLSFNKSKKEKAEIAAKVNSSSSSERQLASANSNASEVATKTAASSEQQPVLAESSNAASADKTILLIGSTGKGKSTLANVLVNKNDNFEEVFKESGGSTSETREIQSEKFVEKNTSYQIIDTVGLSDTKIARNEVLDKIAEAVYLAREGVSQVLFIIDGRFDAKEIANYDLLKSIIFDEQVVDYTTIVRTNFENFRDENECQEDLKKLEQESELLQGIINSCQKRFIHVDNPSLKLLAPKNEEKRPA
jgi:predicted GTPase